MLSPLAVHEAAEALLGCVCEALDELPEQLDGMAGCPCRVCVVPGAPAADGCDGGCDMQPGVWPGQLTVNVQRVYGSDRVNFPAEVQTARDLVACALPQVTAVELVITLWRCSPGPSDDGCPPPCDELAATAMQMHADLLAVQKAVLCCFAATDSGSRKGRRYTMGRTDTLGPQGGCVGFQTLVTVALDDVVGQAVRRPQTGAQSLQKGV